MRVVTIASGKGGVGKSTVSLNLALALAEQGHRVGLLDADLYGPDIPLMIGLTRQERLRSWDLWRSSGPVRLEPVERFGIRVMSAGFLLGEDQALAFAAPLVQVVLHQLLTGVAWGEPDELVVDLPPGTADLQQQLLGLVRPAGAVIVVGPQDVAHLDARKVLDLLRGAQVPVLGGWRTSLTWPARIAGSRSRSSRASLMSVRSGLPGRPCWVGCPWTPRWPMPGHRAAPAAGPSGQPPGPGAARDRQPPDRRLGRRRGRLACYGQAERRATAGGIDVDEQPGFVVEGARVALGPLRIDLVATYQRWENDLEVANANGRVIPFTLEAEHERIAGRNGKPEFCDFTVYDRADQGPIGWSSLFHIDHRNGSAQFGIALGERRGQGLGTEATRLTLDWGFSVLGLHNIMLAVAAWNERAIRVYTKVGFREVGRRRGAGLTMGRRHDGVFMDLLASEFLQAGGSVLAGRAPHGAPPSE